MAPICSRLVTSTANPSTTSPFRLSCPTASRTVSSFTSATATIAPSSRNLRAVARPMPCAAPVMIATLFFSLTSSPGSMNTAECKYVVRILRKIGKFVIGSFDHVLAAARVSLEHRAPIDHLIAGRSDQEVAFRAGDPRNFEREQFVEVFRLHVDRSIRIEDALPAKVCLQIVIRPDRGIEQHGATAQAFRHPGRVVAAERRADQRELLAWFELCRNQRDLGRRARRRRQLRAEVVALESARTHQREQVLRLARMWRRPESMQVEDQAVLADAGPPGRASRSF